MSHNGVPRGRLTLDGNASEWHQGNPDNFSKSPDNDQKSYENPHLFFVDFLDNQHDKEFIRNDSVLLKSKLNLDTDKLAATEVLELL